jgi:HSP20 family protein
MKNIPSTKRDWYLNPLSELENLQREMNKLFDFSTAGSGFPDTSLLGGQWAPAVDLYDSKDDVVVKADLPGVSKDDIVVSIQDNMLNIKGEKKRSSEVKEGGYLRSERFSGSFYRSISLPASVDRDNVRARYNNGVLELTLPKKEEAKPKQIKIDVK